MPAIGMGTFGSDSISPNQIAQAVEVAAGLGYRHFDCAEVYGNELEIGQAFARLRLQGIPRSELFVTSKLWNNHHFHVAEACEKSLRDLGLDELDLYLIHWPFPNHHDKGVDVSSRDHNARPYEHDHYMQVWRELEKLVRRGLVRNVGTSNMTIPKLQMLLRDAEIAPAVNEMELHPHFQQPELFDFVVSQGIVPVAYSPLGSPGRPERDRTNADTVDLEDPTILDLAKKYQCHPAEIAIDWAVQRGQVPIPFSVNPRNLLSNIRAATYSRLTPEECKRMAKIDKNCRLIKGQVFLWPAAKGWEDLWDKDGTIPSNTI